MIRNNIYLKIYLLKYIYSHTENKIMKITHFCKHIDINLKSSAISNLKFIRYDIKFNYTNFQIISLDLTKLGILIHFNKHKLKCTVAYKQTRLI